MSRIVTPAKDGWCGGTPYEFCVQTYLVKTVTNLRAGVFVITDTDDDHIKAAGAEAVNVIGVLGSKNWTNQEWDPTTAPTAEDEVDVILLGTGAYCSVRNGASIVVGSPIATSATGRAAAIGTATLGGMVGRAAQTHDGSGAEGSLVVVV